MCTFFFKSIYYVQVIMMYIKGPLACHNYDFHLCMFICAKLYIVIFPWEWKLPPEVPVYIL